MPFPEFHFVRVGMSAQGSKRIAFIGGGAMGGAMAYGIVDAKIVALSDLSFVEVSTQARQALAVRFPGSHITTDVEEACRKASTIVLAVKPISAPAVLKAIKSVLTSGHLVISIMAGVSIAQIRAVLGSGPRIIRTMPNVALLIRQGATGLAADESCTPGDVAYASELFSSAGVCITVPEKLLDAVTGLSGSGPAYVALFVEALSDAGVLVGIPRTDATRLAAHTVAGAAATIVQGKFEHPALLKDAVCSPGGTSIAGIAALERNRMRSAVFEAVAAATQRSREQGAAQSKL